jgi:hypothetical protein
MTADPTSLIEWGKNLGLTGVCALLGWLLKWSLQRQFSMHEANEKRLEADLEKVKQQRDAARDQMLAEKDKSSERYHRLATEVSGVTKETGAWFEHISRLIASGRGRGGGGTPPPVARHKARAEEDEGGAGT